MYFNGTKCQLLLFSCLLSVSALAKDVKSLNAGGLQKPLCFVENKGQVLDENNHSRKDVQFKLAGKGLNLYIGDGQLHYQFRKVDARKDAPLITSYNMDVALIGADPHAKVVATDKLDYFENYYLSQTGQQGFTVNAYSKVTYANVYPNIDWVLYLNDGKVEYDFVIREGGNPKDIKIQYNGATDLVATANGGILAKTPMGDVTEDKLYAFETKTGKNVPSKYVVNGNMVSFETGNYNGSLTIDPYLTWSTYYGGSGEDVVTAVKVSTGANIYAVGYTASANLPVSTVGGPVTLYQNTFGGSYDAFLVKYNSAGTVQFSTYFGGAGADMGMGLALDFAGTGVFVGGHTTTTGTTFAVPIATCFQNVNNGGADMFLAKFTNNGALSWSTYLGGSNDDKGLTIMCDSAASSNVYIAGYSQSPDIVTTDGTVLNGAQDGFLAKFTNGGTNVWTTYMGGEGDDQINGIAVNNNNFVVATGQTNSTLNIASAGAYQTTLDGTQDGFLAYVRTNLAAPQILWSTYLGGSAVDLGNGVISDYLHNIYVTGTTASTNAIASGTSLPSTNAGFQDAFLMKFSAAGVKNWGTYFGGVNNDNGNAVCTDQFGNITIAGSTSSSGIATAGAFQTGLSGATDAFVAKYNVLGQKLYSTYFGKTGTDFANAIASDPGVTPANASAIILGGMTTSPTNINSGAAAQATYGGGTSDGFVTKFGRDTIVSFRQIFMDTLLCAGSSITVHDTVNYTFGTGNIFRVQLSDATGSFAAPVVIGSVTSSTFGAIPAIIPVGTVAGTGYRIRIVSTNPVTTSVDDNIEINIVTTLPATTVTANSPVCVGQTINFTVTAPYSVNGYSWSGPAGFTSTLQNPSIPSVTTANGGTYSVTVTHANNCPAYINTVPVLVNSFIPPTPLDSSNAPLCAGSTLQLFANPNFSGIFTYHWSGPGGFSSNLQNPVIPSISYADTGFYYLTDTLDACPSLRDSIHIVINPTDTPNIVITVTPDDTVCVGTTFHFHVAVTNGGFSPQYQWLYGPTYPIVGAIFDNYASASLASGANISCVLTSNIACPDKPHDTSNIIVVTVLNNTPVVSITSTATSVLVGSTVTLTGYASGPSIVGYVWYVNGVVVPGATTTTLVLSGLTHSDTVRMEVLSTGICASLGVSNTIIVHVGTVVVNTVPEFSAIEMFPNPNNGSFAIKGQLDNIADGQASVQVTNAIGQVVYISEATIANGQLDKSVDMSNVPAGIYLLRLNKDGASKVFKFVKE